METQDLEEALVTPKVVTRVRLVGLDLFRGFIMIVMAWDHLKDQLGNISMHGSETWQGESPDYNNSGWFFLARIISDICAPGFFFSMGVGMLYFTESRLKKGWTFSAINKYYMKRSFVIFLVGRFLIFSFIGTIVIVCIITGKSAVQVPFQPDVLHWPKDWKPILVLSVAAEFQVMTGLAISMLLSSLMLTSIFKFFSPATDVDDDEDKESKGTSFKFKAAVFFSSLCVLFFALSNAVIVHYEYGDPREKHDEFPGYFAHPSNIWEVFIRFMLIPGALGDRSMAVYPAIPWIGLTLLGIAVGFLFKINIQKTVSLLGKLSIGFAVSFILMRLVGGHFGNIRGFPVGDGSAADDDTPVNPWIEFFYTLKYPPSPAYGLLTMSINFGVIWLFSKPQILSILEGDISTMSVPGRCGKQFLKIILALGNAPLFFYLLHFQVIPFFGYIVSAIYGPNTKLDLQYIPLLWVPLILILYPCCTSFIAFRGRTSENSWWRLI